MSEQRKQLLAYVSGPYRDARGAHFVLANILRARAVAVELWKMGFAVICPHANTILMDGACPDEVWLKGDLVMVERCDLIVMIPGWQRSQGAFAEMDHAVAHGVPVYYWDGEQSLLAKAAESGDARAFRSKAG